MPPIYILLGLMLLHTPSSGAANDTLTAGQALAVGRKLVSRNGKFALGFFQPASTISKSHNASCYFGIWFNKIPVFTTLWVANREEPITDPLTRLKISGDGNLVILSHGGTQSAVWSTHVVSRTQTSINTTSAVLLNSGNLALTESPSSDILLWQSSGMVLMEILSGKRNSPETFTSSSDDVEYFPVEAISKLHEADVGSLVDPQLHGDFDMEQVERVCKVACWCIQDNEADRPTMGEVVWVLEGLQEIDMPTMPRLLAAMTAQSDETSL